MTDLIERLEALAGKVTPGGWSYVRNPENTRWIIDSKPAHAIACTAGFEPDNEANAAAICLLRNNLPTVAEIIADVLGLGAAHGIGPATRLCADLGTDSLDRQSIAADCDIAFGIEIPDADVAEWETVADVAGTVARLCREGVVA